MIIFLLVFEMVVASRMFLQGQEEDVQTRVSLSECIVEACKKYFNEPFQVISYMLPTADMQNHVASYFVITHQVLRALESEARWNIMIKSLIGKAYPFKFVTKTTGYIMQIRGSGEVANSLKILKKILDWNPHAKFIVVSTTAFDDPVQVATDMTNDMMKYQILNGVIMLSNPENRSVFNVYSWEPYSNRSCGDNYEHTSIDRCSYGNTESDVSWFTNKFPTDFYNCTLKVLYTRWAPFVTIDNPRFKKSSSTDAQGIEVNVINMISEILNLFAVYQEDDLDGYGTVYDNGTTTGGFTLLSNNEADVMIGGYDKSFGKMFYMDTSKTYIQDTLIWCVSHERTDQGLRPMVVILSVEVWIAFGTVFFVTTLVLWCLSKKSTTESSTYKDLTKCFLTTFLVVIGFGANDLPRAGLIRYFMGLFIVFNLFINIIYTSYLTSSLSSQSFGEKFSKMEDIYKYKLTTYFLRDTERYFSPYTKDEDNYIQSVPIRTILDNWRTCVNISYCFEQILEGNHNAFCVTELHKEYIFSGSGELSQSKEKPYCLNKPVIKIPVNIVMRKGFNLYNVFQSYLDRITSAGFITKWKKDILYRKYEKSSSNAKLITFGNLVLVFQFVAFVQLLSIIVFIAELVFYKSSHDISACLATH
ncbi:uncharacterized protein LOC126886756 [Diabrotica virgifera virgifera]|uniref:Uncharacterized protein LOC114337527 n=1 Tax=Diabrotica virgifera virgifera TaxID=50390 RepID=A0A6P7GJ49_DIAVI|nr:uncharacterized protein LOC126886756 [Diabrotica virgifera virgifera]KAI2474169.1 Ionotropic receptor 101 [Diabrotica virgifera virgifera]